MTLLEVQKLTRYFGGLAAVNEVDMEVDAGEIRGLIGPNGSGKTTMFNLISGVIRPTGGKVIFNGEDITNLEPHFVAKRGLIRTFQLTTLFFGYSVLENVLLGLQLQTKVGFWEAVLNTSSKRRKERELEKKAMDLLEDAGVAHLRGELAGNLPHGYQRLVEIAIALAAQPKLLMLDEPVCGMNPEEKDEMIAYIRRIRDRGITILLVEHDMRVIMGICDRISVLNFGQKLAEGLPKEIGENEAVIEAYLGAEDYAA